MKLKSLMFILGIILICSCSKAPEEIMKQNLYKFMKEKYLFIPDSYKPAKFEIKDTIYAGDLLHEVDSLDQLRTRVKTHQESFCRDLDVLIEAYQNNRYHNRPKLKELMKTRDETEQWIKETTNITDSLGTLLMKRTGNTWACRNPKSTMFYKVLHTYEAKNTDGNMGVYVTRVYFDTTYQIYKIYIMNY